MTSLPHSEADADTCHMFLTLRLRLSSSTVEDDSSIGDS